MRKKLIVVLTLSLFLCSVGLAMAAAPAIFVNGNALVSDNPAVIENDRTLLPLRVIFEALGQQVDWHADDRSITSGNIWLQIDNPVATVNGENVNLDVPAKIINDLTYVPLRFIAESLDKDVIWDGSQFRVDINDKPIADEGAADEGAADEGAVDEGAADEGAVDEGAVDEDTPLQEDAE